MTLWTSYLGAEVRWIDATGIRTRVAFSPSMSDARPILLLHGRGGHLESFHRNVGALSRHAPLISVDLLGHALTGQAGTTYDIAEITEHIWQVMDQLDDGRGFDIVAQSLGAWAAMRTAIARPERIGRLVLIEPAGLQRHQDRLGDPRVQRASQAGGQAFDDPSEDNVRLRFAQLLHDPLSVDPEMVAVRQRFYSLPGATDVHKSVRTADNDPYVLERTQLAASEIPMLFVRGEFGHLPQPLLESLAQQIPESGLVTIDDAKQWPHYEQPDPVNKSIIQFLER